MSTGTIWALVGASAVVTALIKGAGPFALGGRTLPPRLVGVVALLAPALLAALVVTQALAEGRHVGPGADTVGVAAAGVLLLRGASILVAVAAAAVVTAGLRAL
jgi:branched-subunit amino acid transport protein